MKTAVVLGITGGVGQEIAKMLLSHKYRIIGTAQEIPKTHPFSSNPNLTIHKLNIENRGSIDAFCDQLKGLHIDFFTSTIGCYTINRFEKTPIETFEKDFGINFMNHVYLLQKIIPHVGKGSHIVFILTEMVVDRTPAFLSTYVSSKYALLGLMKALSSEYGPKGIRINAVSPGMMDTKFISPMPLFVREAYAKNSKKGRFTQTKEVAEAIEKILSDPEMNGRNIPVF